jgi:hypothetical protein
MKILLAVPSKNRWREDEIKKNTLSWLQFTEYDWQVFVEHHEYKLYKKITSNVVDIGVNNSGIGGVGFVKTKIQEYAIENGYDLIMSIDDDLNSIACPRIDGFKGKVSTQERVKIKWDWMIRESIDAFEIFPKLGGVSVFEGGGKFKVKDLDVWMKVNQRLETCYIVRTELYCPPRCIEIPVFQDFSTYIYLRVLGYFTLTSGITGWHVRNPVGQGSGGCQDYDRLKLAMKAKKILTEIYPDLKWRDRRGEKIWGWEPSFRSTKMEDLIKTAKLGLE